MTGNWGRKLCLVGVLLLVIYGLGPRVRVEYEPQSIPPESIADVDQYLADCEARADVPPLDGVEKKVVWRYPDHRQTELALVYLHGFSASRQDLAPVPERVAEVLDANLFLTRLAAHGQGAEAFASVSANDWLNDAAEAVQIGARLGERTILMGHSTGATLGLWIANRSDRVAALILLSPNFGLAKRYAEIALYPWGRSLARLLKGRYHEFSAANELQQRYWTTRYRSEGLLEMIALVDYCRDEDYANLDVPCMSVYSTQDKVIDLDYMRKHLRKVGKRSVVMQALDGSPGHELAGDILAPQTTERLIDMIQRFLQDQVNVVRPPPILTTD